MKAAGLKRALNQQIKLLKDSLFHDVLVLALQPQMREFFLHILFYVKS